MASTDRTDSDARVLGQIKRALLAPLRLWPEGELPGRRAVLAVACAWAWIGSCFAVWAAWFLVVTDGRRIGGWGHVQDRALAGFLGVAAATAVVLVGGWLLDVVESVLKRPGRPTVGGAFVWRVLPLAAGSAANLVLLAYVGTGWLVGEAFKSAGFCREAMGPVACAVLLWSLMRGATLAGRGTKRPDMAFLLRAGPAFLVALAALAARQYVVWRLSPWP